jgi:hypothetical protein
MQHGRLAVFEEMARESFRRINPSLVSMLLGGLLIVSGCVPASYEGSAQEPVNDVQYLESYGEWFEMPPYGIVWHPFVVRDWAPFSHGHWMWTNDGWAWVSYEPFGWLVYHYGFWDYRREIGWFWVPDDAWSPARVEWYTDDDYCAWAPLPPPDVYWPAPWEPFDTDLWIVVPIDRFTDENVGRRRITKPLPRELARRESVGSKQPPEIRIVRERANRSLAPVTIRKEPVEILSRPPVVQSPSIAPRDSSLERMVLPRNDKRTVDKYSPEVRREVLAPRKASPPPEQRAPERKPDSVRTKSPNRR